MHNNEQTMTLPPPTLTASPSAASGLRRITLPNGMTVACHTTTEARFFYDDIFVKRIYHRHGISLDQVEQVFDVGANIGLFSLFMHRFCPRAKIYAFEASPPTFAILSANLASHGVAAKPFNLGIADREGEAEFTHYLSSSGMSSLYADETEEREALAAIFKSQQRRGIDGMDEVMRHADELLEERLRCERFRVPLAPLSKVIRDEGIARIDLLKIDVQKAEAEVLAGLDAADWPKVRQIVIEVHDIAGRVAAIRSDLEGRGFSVVVEQDEHYDASETYNLFAVRPESGAAAGAALPSVSSRANRLLQALGKGRGVERENAR